MIEYEPTIEHGFQGTATEIVVGASIEMKYISSRGLSYIYSQKLEHTIKIIHTL
jgi:hypothetical protein